MNTRQPEEHDVGEWPRDGLDHAGRCPVCGCRERQVELSGLRDRVFGVAPGQWTLYRCAACSTTYLDPRPDPATIGLAYRDYYTHSVAQPHGLREWARKAIGNSCRNYFFATRLRPAAPLGWLMTRIFREAGTRIRFEDRTLEHGPERPSNVLDVGCGNGDFLTIARSLGWNGYGVEIDPAASSVVRGLGFEIIAAQLPDVDARYSGFFDVVTVGHVIEHVHDPVDLMRHCLRVLRPGGYVWVETPNIDSVGYALYQDCWQDLDPPRHLAIFSPSSLRTCMEGGGFERVQFLRPRDVMASTFLGSARIKSGGIASSSTARLPKRERYQLAQNVEHARQTVARDPERADYMTAIGYRPE